MLVPAVEELQRGEETRWRWVNYSAFDAKVGWALRHYREHVCPLCFCACYDAEWALCMLQQTEALRAAGSNPCTPRLPPPPPPPSCRPHLTCTAG